MLLVRLLIVWLPDVTLVPLQPPEAVQEFALVDDQVSCVLPPVATLMGFAVNVTVGAGGGGVATATVTERLLELVALEHDRT